MAAAGSTEDGERKDEAEEDEVEEQLVMVELSGIIDSDFLEKCENKCKILGIETERPILQVDRYVFAGEYEDTLGTCVVFEENTEHVDAEGNQKVQLKYKCHTMKKLNMTRTLLTEKKEGEENVGGVEWLQIKDRDFSYSRPNTICSFLREKEDSEESAQAQDKLTEESEGEKAGAMSLLLPTANSSALLISPKKAQRVGYFKYSSKLVGGRVCGLKRVLVGESSMYLKC
ncbi:general transcription factor 3C polypeptide 6 isoform 1-T1 [Ciconia maguari]